MTSLNQLHNYILIVIIAPSFQFDRLTCGYIWTDNLCEMLYPGLVCVLLTLCTRVMITLPISRYGQSWVTRNQETCKEKKICQQLLLINQLIYQCLDLSGRIVQICSTTQGRRPNKINLFGLEWPNSSNLFGHSGPNSSRQYRFEMMKKIERISSRC